MAEEEPRMTTLQERIAALNKSQADRPTHSYNGPSTAGKRPTPPPVPKPDREPRPQPDFRSKSINNPPVATFSSVGNQYSNEPTGQKQLAILPPPPVDRDSPSPSVRPFQPRKSLPPTIPPPLPRRENSQTSLTPKPSPSLPPRKASGQLMARRGSNESMLSISSSISAFSMGTNGASSISSVESNAVRNKLPPSLDQANLPALPPTKRELEAKAKLEREEKAREMGAAKGARLSMITSKSSPAVPRIAFHTPQYPLQNTIPPLPGRSPSLGAIVPSLPHRSPSLGATVPPLPSRSPQLVAARSPMLPPRLPSRSSSAAAPTAEVSMMHSLKKLPLATPPPMPQRVISDRAPPPVPRDTRPPLSQLESRITAPAKPPRPGNPTTNGNQGIYCFNPNYGGCMICRDFSGPDNVAKQHPRATVPQGSTQYLASVLCDQFDSPTDKARAIFTWLHYNIDYDTEAFFNKTIKNVTPESTISRGLAVCGGYAGLYTAIALHAGLECIMVVGHGKGYSYTNYIAGTPIPAENPTGHAWNAVRIDNGEWKLIDPCWGAGHVSNKLYCRKFNPSEFTKTNEEFGLKHFPSNAEHFYRSDGRALSWEEYIVGPNPNAPGPPQVYGVLQDYGIKETSFLPASKEITVSSSSDTKTHFQFSKMCEHWDFKTNGTGTPYCMTLQIGGVDGREKDFIPFEFDGTYWWCEVDTRRLGKRGERINVYSVTTVGGKDARGLSKAGYLSKKGKEGMGFQTVASWDLV